MLELGARRCLSFVLEIGEKQQIILSKIGVVLIRTSVIEFSKKHLSILSRK